MKTEDTELSGRIIGDAIRVHEELGPGFLESIYEEALCLELKSLVIQFQRQLLVPVRYRDAIVGEHRLDLLIESMLVVEGDKVLARFAPELCRDHTSSETSRTRMALPHRLASWFHGS